MHRKRWIRKIALLLCCMVLTVTFLSACKEDEGDSAESGETEQTQQSADETQQTEVTIAPMEVPDAADTAMTVNGEAVGTLEYRYYLTNAKAQLDQDFPSYFTVNPEMTSRVTETAQYYVQRNRAVFSLAQARGVSLTTAEKNEIARQTLDEMEQYGGEDIFLQALEASGMDLAFYQYQAQVEYLEEKLLESYIADGTITDDDATLRTLMQGDDFILCQHIILQPTTDAEVQEKLDLAQSIVTRLENGEDFETLMQSYSEDTLAAPEGDLFCRGFWADRALEDACFALQVGESSGVVKTVYGYMIVHRCDKTGYSVSDELFASEKSDYQRAVLEQLLRTEMATQSVNLTEVGAAVDVFSS